MRDLFEKTFVQNPFAGEKPLAHLFGINPFTEPFRISE